MKQMLQVEPQMEPATPPLPRIEGRLIRVIAACAVLIVPAAVWLLMGNPLDPFDDRSFSPRAWKTAEPEQRAKMSRDLVQNHIRAGMSLQQVFSLIGETDYTREGEPGIKEPRGTRFYVYYIGGWSSGMDDAFVYVEWTLQTKLLVRKSTATDVKRSQTPASPARPDGFALYFFFRRAMAVDVPPVR
ncbi:MAG TPA: hypothetical protein VF669_18605 [Tepidisphaeraceae bacterium]